MEKACENCGEKMARKRFNGRLEDWGVFLRRRFCGAKCCGKAHRKAMPSKSGLLKRPEVKRACACERCGSTAMINAHHVDGDRLNNAPDNLMSLCPSCHTKWHWEHGKSIPKRNGAGLPVPARRNTTGKRRESAVSATTEPQD